MTIRVFRFLACLFVYAATICPTFAQAIHKNPHRIILNLTIDPSTSMAITWRTIDETKSPVVQISKPTDWTEFGFNANTINARKEQLTLNNGTSVFHYSAVAKSLNPDTKYSYRVGGDSAWSEWNQFGTANSLPEQFSFVYFGDAQHGLGTFYPRIVREAFKKNPQASFWLFAGDLIDRPQYDSLWDEFFNASDFVQSIVPCVMVPGNHEYPQVDSGSGNVRTVVGLWNRHFTLPENGVKGLEETSYWFDYQGVRFVMLNGNEKLSEQARWMDSVLATNSSKWTVAVVHQPVFSMAKTRDQRKTREAFMPVFDKYAVDIVLQGHDHVYARSAKLRNGARVNGKEKGTVYVTSQCGSDGYVLNSLYQSLMEKTGFNLQLYQVVSIDSDTLSFKTFTATGSLFDSFTLSKF
jgi:acid phosphatase type 7